MKGATFNRLAERELAEAVEFYESARLGLGEEFLEEVEHATVFLGRYPEAAPRVGGAIRRFVLPRFPYFLIYRPLGSGRIRILAVAHQRRRPLYWIGRD
jgi:toxin ParE1/3/4